MTPGLEQLGLNHLVGLEACRETIAKLMTGVSGLVHEWFLNCEVVSWIGAVSCRGGYVHTGRCGYVSGYR